MTRPPELALVRPSPASESSSRLDVWWGRVRQWLGRTANALRYPAVVQPMEISDPVTGCSIEIRVGSLFTVISVDGRDYYFKRLTGRFDGTGMGCS